MESRFGTIETIFAENNIDAIFNNKDCYPEEISPKFISTVIPVVKDKLTQWVENCTPEELGDATQVCKQITAVCNWTAIWSKDPLPATMYYAACMGALWGIPKFRNSLKSITRDEFRVKYPEFDQLAEEEQLHLYHFRNALLFGFVVVKAYRNKGLLIDLIPRLSESRVYTLGGGIGPTTQRRVLIYEREGNIPKRKQPIRVDHVMRLLDSSGDSSDPTNQRGGGTGDLHGFNFFNQFDIEVPVEMHHSDHGHYSHSYRSKDELPTAPKSGSVIGAGDQQQQPPQPPGVSSRIGRVVEFLSHNPEDGVTIRTVSIRNGDNEELARHAGILQIHDDNLGNNVTGTRHASTASNISNFSAFTTGADGGAVGIDDDDADRDEMNDLFVEDFSNMNHRDAFVGSLDEMLDNHNLEFNHSLSSFPAEAQGAGIEYAVVPKSIPLNLHSMSGGGGAGASNANLLVDPQDDGTGGGVGGGRDRTESGVSVLEDFMFDVEMPIGHMPLGSRNNSTSFSSVVHNGRMRMSSTDYNSLPAFRHNSAGSRQSSVDGLPAIYMPPVTARSTKISRKINRCQSRDDFYLVESVERYLLSNDALAPCPDPEDPVTDRSPVIINAQMNSENQNRYPASSLQHNDNNYASSSSTSTRSNGNTKSNSNSTDKSNGGSSIPSNKKVKGPSPQTVDKIIAGGFQRF